MTPPDNAARAFGAGGTPQGEHEPMSSHYVKLTQDAAPMLDSLIHRLTDEGHSFALLRTEFRFDQLSVTVKPAPQDRDVVFGLATEEFNAAGWGYGSTLASEQEDATRPVVAITFRHPSQRTRVGEPRPPRPRAIGFEIPLPHPAVPITTDLIEYYSKRASEITKGLMAQQVVEEEGKMPGTPGQGVQPLPVRKVMTLSQAFAPVAEDDDDAN